MKSTRERRAWAVYALCVVAGSAVMAWLTGATMRLERAEARARAEVAHRAALSAALWRMDSWLAPQLAREASRAPEEYDAYVAQQEAYTKTLGKLAPGEILRPSPLLTADSDVFVLYFQIAADGTVSSPQAPRGNWLDLAQANAPHLDIEGKRRLLERIAPYLGRPEVLAKCETLQRALPDLSPVSPSQLRQNVAVAPGWTTFQRRALSTRSARAGASARVGPLLPVWVRDATGEPWLVYLRRVRQNGGERRQGFVVDWRRLRRELLARAEDVLSPGAVLRPVEAPDVREQSHMLATVPAVLEAPCPPPRLAGWSPVRVGLVVGWAALGTALFAAWFTLRSSLRFGRRRARFASAVTHELRTPLTTFRMYSEMLARDMVADPARRTRYLETLCREADRLSRIVENVLAHSRIEDGRSVLRRRRVTAAELVEVARAGLERCADEAGMELVVGVSDPEAELETDPEAVAQILANLVENACKYARGGTPTRVELAARVQGEDLVLSVRDHGPGVPARLRRRIFRPFDRGELREGDNEAPGLGLGLAIARELADALGGTLDVEAAAPGARFMLRLPTCPRHGMPSAPSAP